MRFAPLPEIAEDATFASIAKAFALLLPILEMACRLAAFKQTLPGLVGSTGKQKHQMGTQNSLK
jgi:hypothetical protein